MRGLAAIVSALALAAPTGATGAKAISVTVDRAAVSTTLGRKFVFHTAITNRSDTPARGLIAHLNVLSLREGVYVDPEDWSSHRTRYLAPIPAHSSVPL